MPRRSVLLIVLAFPLLARADVFGASDAKMIVQLTQMVKTLEEQLKVVKRTYDIGADLYELSQGDLTSVDRVLNTELVALMKEKGWMLDGLTTLQTLSDVDRQLTTLTGLLADAKDADTRQRVQTAMDLLKQQRTLVQLAAQTRKNLDKATTDLSARDSSRITAENTAVLARAALAAQEARNRDTAIEKAARSDEAAFTRGAARIYTDIGQP
jgi:hypothetical protein